VRFDIKQWSDQTELISHSLLQWYHSQKRDLPWRSSQDPYRVWISEIMLQQTQVERVKEYFRNFIERFPTVFDLAKAEEAIVLKYWEGLGYYRRAPSITPSGKGNCNRARR